MITLSVITLKGPLYHKKSSFAVYFTQINIFEFVFKIRNDLFNDRTGLRRSAFPIKLAGIKMGSHENLNVDNDDDDGGNIDNNNDGNGNELHQLWRRRSRRNSLSMNDSRRNSLSVNNSATNSLDRRSLYITPSTEKPSTNSSTPFGSTGTKILIEKSMPDIIFAWEKLFNFLVNWLNSQNSISIGFAPW